MAPEFAINSIAKLISQVILAWYFNDSIMSRDVGENHPLLQRKHDVSKDWPDDRL